jgi:hypothetical protein
MDGRWAAIVLAVSEWLLEAIINPTKSRATWLVRKKNAADFLVRQTIQQTIDAAVTMAASRTIEPPR